MFEVLLTDEFEGWLESLPDRQTRMRIVARIRRAGFGNFGDWRPISGRLAEMRLHYGPGYRLYFTRRRQSVIVILAGGHKGSQARDIAKANEILDVMSE